MSLPEERDLNSVDPQVWNYPVIYLGGHSSFTIQRKGTLFIHTNPTAKAFFECFKYRMEFPLNKVKDVQISTEHAVNKNMFIVGILPALIARMEEKVLTVSFEDNSGNKQTPMFQFIIDNKQEYDTIPEQAKENLTKLLVKKSETPLSQQPVPFPEKKFFCRYCGSQNQIDAKFCESCGKQLKQF
jgi:hypothetical protein